MGTPPRTDDMPRNPTIKARPRRWDWFGWLRWLTRNPVLLAPLLGGWLLILAYATLTYDGPHWLRYVLLAASFVCSARYTAAEALSNLRARRFDVDILMFAAAFGAVMIDHYYEGALLLCLFGLGTAGETLAMDHARRAISALADFAPDTAIVLYPDGRERTVSVEKLTIGDLVVARPFDRITADGDVIEGSSAVDQSAITGESLPVEKTSGDGVFAGTVNGAGRLVISVSRPSTENTLAKIVRLVEEAQSARSPTQVLTDRVQRWYVPAVLILTVGLIVIPSLLSGGWSLWFYRAMAFLTAASPCALAIGTPAAVLSGIARAARGGVLIKGGVHLENLGRVRVVAFDKTGTLTCGKPRLTDVVVVDGGSRDELLRLAAAVGRGTSHPLAIAIVAEAETAGLANGSAEAVEEMPGIGAVGTVDGHRVFVGRAAGLADSAAHRSFVEAHATILAAEGKSLVVVAVDEEVRGILALADRPRAGAADAIAELNRLGIERTIMLSGDRRQTVASVARHVGVDEHAADLLPEEKLDRIAELEKQYGFVAMVGDGVNDAPALAQATVGIAMGGAASDVALETADVVLMGDDLARLPEVIGLSRMSRRIIAQNLFIALSVIAVLAPTAALGGASLGAAVAFHEGSTVLVVLNALRLLFYKPRNAPG